jgi:hypothetical protein
VTTPTTPSRPPSARRTGRSGAVVATLIGQTQDWRPDRGAVFRAVPAPGSRPPRGTG